MIKYHLDLDNPIATQQDILDYWLPKINLPETNQDPINKMLNYQELIIDLNNLKIAFKKYRVMINHLETLDKTIKRYQRKLRSLKKKMN